jgi:hypothetical protein
VDEQVNIYLNQRNPCSLKAKRIISQISKAEGESCIDRLIHPCMGWDRLHPKAQARSFELFSQISSHLAVFFSHNKPANSTFNHNKPAKRTGCRSTSTHSVCVSLAARIIWKIADPLNMLAHATVTGFELQNPDILWYKSTCNDISRLQILS